MESIMFTTLIKRFISILFNLNSLIINLFSFHAVTPLGILFSLIFLLILSCEKDLSPVKLVQEKEIQIKLTVESAEVTEAWLKLETSPLESEAVYIVKRDTHFVFNGKLDKSDTLLHDENLLPAHEYNYNAYAVLNGKTSKIVKASLTTMDTTSHDFDWEIFEWGHHSSSCLHDVAIISTEDIWAVGEIHTEDTDCWNEDSTEWISPYNAVHWDGNKWELKWIPFTGCGAVKYPTIRAILAFSNDDIWFARGGSLVHFDGNKYYNDCRMNSLLAGSINKIWGTDSDNLYIVGGEGSIVHYNGQSWQKIDSGTDLPIQDIWGSYDAETDESYILCPASYKYQLGDKKLLSINSDKSITEENWPFSDRRVHSVWFKDKSKVFICGAGVFVRNQSVHYKEFTEIPLIFTNRIRANDINDIFVAGDFGLIAHYNGINWHIYSEADAGLFYSMDYKENIAAAVGEENSKAIILIMKRK
jgi:hypothetical protein